MEDANFHWVQVFNELRASTPETLAEAFGLRSLKSSGEAYDQALMVWASEARTIGGIALGKDGNGNFILRRSLDKAKHGVHLTAFLFQGQPSLIVPPKPQQTTAPIEPATLRLVETSARISLQVSRLTCALVGQWYANRWGREPSVPDQVFSLSLTDTSIKELIESLDGPLAEALA